MACNTCLKSFSLLRPEKGCPGCGFSYCSKCINHKVFLKKINSDTKVCFKCSRTANSNEPIKINPPDVYYKRINAINPSMNNKSVFANNSEKEIYDRLQKLKEDNKEHTANSSTNDIAARLQKLKGEIPSTSDAEIAARLASLKGVPTCEISSKAALLKPDLRTEQEQADDLFKQYLDQAKIDSFYSNEFDGLVNDIEKRLENLKGTSEQKKVTTTADSNITNNEDEMLRKIIEEAKAKVTLEESEICDPGIEELPFCEICNEDANMRCLGCKYLFCKRCFIEHKDDDDGCNKYETYTPKNA